MTPADLIAKYIELRDFMKVQSDAFTEKMKPYNDAMQAIEGTMLELLNQQGLDNMKCAGVGTAYKNTSMTVRNADPAAFLNYVFEHDRRDLLTAAVNKTAVQEFMDANNGVLPPGVDVTYYTKCQFRRA